MPGFIPTYALSQWTGAERALHPLGGLPINRIIQLGSGFFTKPGVFGIHPAVAQAATSFLLRRNNRPWMDSPHCSASRWCMDTGHCGRCCCGIRGPVFCAHVFSSLGEVPRSRGVLCWLLEGLQTVFQSSHTVPGPRSCEACMRLPVSSRFPPTPHLPFWLQMPSPSRCEVASPGLGAWLFLLVDLVGLPCI